jgi:toxin CptA
VGSVTCDIQYSGRVGALPCLAALATGVLAFAMPMEVPLRVVLLLWILLVTCGALRRLATVRRIRVDEDGAISVERADGQALEGYVRRGSCVLPWLVVIRWRPRGAWIDRTLLVLPRMTAPEPFRALRVLLRWQKP